MKCAALLFSSAASAALPPNFPCSVPPTVLESKEKGWPAVCLNLVGDPDESTTSTSAACKAKCIANPDCSVWQLTTDKVCYVSKADAQATNCWGREPATDGTEFVALGGERLQHGTINVSTAIVGNGYYAGLHPVGAFVETPTAAAQQERCKHQCYSDIWCNKWILVAGTSTDSAKPSIAIGCYVQNKESVEQSLTTAPPGQTTVGESIVHTCTPPVTKTTPESNLFIVMLITLLICIVICVGLIIAILLCRKPAEKKSVSRAVKVSPKPMQQALVPMVPMPVMVTQPTVAYAAPPAIAAPSYQVVPQAQSTTFASVPLI